YTKGTLFSPISKAVMVCWLLSGILMFCFTMEFLVAWWFFFYCCFFLYFNLKLLAVTSNNHKNCN
ncbi:hypothetical protein AAJ76_3200045582, partial [Vairimorpha ceranae]